MNLFNSQQFTNVKINKPRLDIEKALQKKTKNSWSNKSKFIHLQTRNNSITHTLY